MASPDGGQPHFVTDFVGGGGGGGGGFLPPIPEHECFTGRGELQLVVASSRASSLSGGHLSLLSSSLGPIGHDEDDDDDVEAVAAAAAASFPPRGAGNSNPFDCVHGGGEGCSVRESLSRASHHDLAFEWSMLCQECTECWSGTGKRTRPTDRPADRDLIGGRGISKLERCGFADSDRWGDPEWGSKNSTLVWEFLEMLVAGHRTVRSRSCPPLRRRRRRRSQSQEKENGFLEFMRQVRRREGKRERGRDKSPGRWTSLTAGWSWRSGPYSLLRKYRLDWRARRRR